MHMRYLILLCLATMLFSCDNDSSNNEGSGAGQVIPANETPSELGLLFPKEALDDSPTYITSFEFAARLVDSTYLDIFEDGVIPWVSLETPDLDNLIDGNELLIEEGIIYLVIDYPVKKPFLKEITAASGRFTRKELMQQISGFYKQMYVEEEETASIKTISVEDRPILNRNETDGKYGIWGHDLGDLDLSGIDIFKGQSGKTYVYLYIES